MTTLAFTTQRLIRPIYNKHKIIIQLFCFFLLISNIHVSTLHTQNVYNGNEHVIESKLFIPNYKIGTTHTVDIHQCIRLCFYWKLCRSVNYHTGKGRCRFNCRAKDESITHVSIKEQFEYTDITVYPSKIAGSCQSHTCTDDHRCYPNGPSYRCVPIHKYYHTAKNLRMRHYDFDENLCGWSQDDTEMGNWLLHSGSTNTSGTGPSGDHTTGDGSYIYMDGKRPSIAGNKMRLISDELPANTAFHISFWYHMWSNALGTMGTLNMYIQISGSSKSLMFTRTGNQGPDWLYHEIDISPQTDSLVIIFEAVRGPKRQSDICLDDIAIR